MSELTAVQVAEKYPQQVFEIMLAAQRSPDEETLRRQYVPQKSDPILPLEDFKQRGQELVQGARYRFRILGELALYGLETYKPEKQSQYSFECQCAGWWGCTRSTISKALKIATTTVELPEGMSQAIAYELLSGTENDAEAERVIALATSEGWNSRDLQEIKSLRRRGLLKEWVRPDIIRHGNELHIQVGSTVVPFATLTASEVKTIQVGVALLQMRARWSVER